MGGAVARERLRDATEAFELAERQEREIEAEYEAWRLLLDQMKEADAAQERISVRPSSRQSRNGRGVDPATLPHRPAHCSIGHRRHYRLGCVEVGGPYLGRDPRTIVYVVPAVSRGIFRPAIVLDDQLVQSDEAGWTGSVHCLPKRPTISRSSYSLAGPATISPQARSCLRGAPYCGHGRRFIRAVDLGRALRRRRDCPNSELRAANVSEFRYCSIEA